MKVEGDLVIAESARRHAIGEDDVLHAYNNPILVEDLDEAIESGKVPAEIDLLDIREPFEAKIAQIPHSRLISLAEFSKRMHELDSAREIWLYCKDGARSGKAWKMLYDAGFRKIKNVAGGIDAWSEEIDPDTPHY